MEEEQESSELTAQDMWRLHQHHSSELAKCSQDIQQCERLISDYAALRSTLATLPNKRSYEIMVPFCGNIAFFPGRLVHTNEVTALLGDNWFADLSAHEAQELAKRRENDVHEALTKFKKQEQALTGKLKFSSQLTSDLMNEDVVEIKEELTEEDEKLINMNKRRSKIKVSQSSHVNKVGTQENYPTKVKANIEMSSSHETDDNYWKRLERQEEANEEMVESVKTDRKNLALRSTKANIEMSSLHEIDDSYWERLERQEENEEMVEIVESDRENLALQSTKANIEMSSSYEIDDNYWERLERQEEENEEVVERVKSDRKIVALQSTNPSQISSSKELIGNIDSDTTRIEFHHTQTCPSDEPSQAEQPFIQRPDQVVELLSKKQIESSKRAFTGAVVEKSNVSPKPCIQQMNERLTTQTHSETLNSTKPISKFKAQRIKNRQQ